MWQAEGPLRVFSFSSYGIIALCSFLLLLGTFLTNRYIGLSYQKQVEIDEFLASIRSDEENILSEPDTLERLRYNNSRPGSVLSDILFEILLPHQRQKRSTAVDLLTNLHVQTSPTVKLTQFMGPTVEDSALVINTTVMTEFIQSEESQVFTNSTMMTAFIESELENSTTIENATMTTEFIEPELEDSVLPLSTIRATEMTSQSANKTTTTMMSQKSATEETSTMETTLGFSIPTSRTPPAPTQIVNRSVLAREEEADTRLDDLIVEEQGAFSVGVIGGFLLTGSIYGLLGIAFNEIGLLPYAAGLYVTASFSCVILIFFNLGIVNAPGFFGAILNFLGYIGGAVVKLASAALFFSCANVVYLYYNNKKDSQDQAEA